MRSQKLADHFRGRGPLINIVLDGWGIGAHDEGDAIFLARKPVMDRLLRDFPNSTILTHGPYVGLPSPKDIGGSEVGHLTLGAGRIFPQGPTRIKQAIDSGEFQKGEVLNELVSRCASGGGALHLVGLLSDGNVHSHIDHFYAVIEHARSRGVRRLYVHALLDGRDVPYQSALTYVEPMEERLRQIVKEQPGFDYAIASGGGREVITMDRDQNWDKVKRGWDVHVHGEGAATFPAAKAAVQSFRKRMPDAVDQDLPPFVIVRNDAPVGAMRDGDAAILMNFRGDRAIEFSQAMVLDNFPHFDRGARPKVLYAGMMVYDEDTDLPPKRLMSATKVAEPFGRRVLELGLTQFRLAESQKYAHVTFFYNGGYREPLDPTRETYHLIPSDKIDSFAHAPAMKAKEIGAQAVEFIRGGEFAFGLINFANTDMVGHTGDAAAAALAAEAVDVALGRIVAAIEEAKGFLVITADHGNADEMISLNPKTGKREPNTRHSLNPVPVILVDPLYKPGDYRMLENDGGKPLTLSRIAATNFLLLGRRPPDDIEDPLIV
jgi:2,3-bisphosphoglycerate-independent phosphoglycerate mutase